MTAEQVSLAKVSGPESVSNGVLTQMDNGEILVTVETVPKGEFVVVVKGTDKLSNSQFQRQSNTQMSLSKVKIMVCLFNFSFNVNVFCLTIISDTMSLIQIKFIP